MAEIRVASSNGTDHPHCPRCNGWADVEILSEPGQHNAYRGQAGCRVCRIQFGYAPPHRYLVGDRIGCECSVCGCGEARVLSLPGDGWLSHGKAVCVACGDVYAIRLKVDEPADPSYIRPPRQRPAGWYGAQGMRTR